MHPTLPRLADTSFPAIRRLGLQVLQVNLGYRCNQSCNHCHVAASPNRTEAMDGETVDLVIEVLKARKVATLDLTGGAPELNPHFRRLVSAARALGVKVMDRCNLTILSEPGQEGLAAFLAGEQVEIIASLPCYLEDNVDAQRGKGVYARSIDGLKALNALGYGREGSGRIINLVYNPGGPSLPPAQGPLEAAYKHELKERHGIDFNALFVLANMPIQRFGSTLISKKGFEEYVALLKGAHRVENLAAVMCRTTVSVSYTGALYDCDFNQMLDLPVAGAAHLRDLLTTDLGGAPIAIADHCFGCTAGQGSSCGGALAAAE